MNDFKLEDLFENIVEKITTEKLIILRMSYFKIIIC